MSPEYSSVSRARLSTCHEDLQLLFNEVILTYDTSIICGFRDAEDQDKAFSTGRSKVQYPWSKHNRIMSRAVDAGPYDSTIRNIPWYNGVDRDMSFTQIAFELENLKQWYSFGGYVRATAERLGIKIRWGGHWDGDFNFKDQNFHDLPHFELIGEEYE